VVKISVFPQKETSTSSGGESDQYELKLNNRNARDVAKVSYEEHK